MPRHSCWMPLLAVALLGSLLPFSSLAAAPGYGELRPGAISVAEQSGVRCELCRDHLFDPARLRARLPAGYRLMLASTYAEDDSSVADLLAKHPSYSNFAVGSLCFMSVDTFLVEGQRVHGQGPTAMAFWWAHAEAMPGTLPDSAMQGRTEWLQLGSWYSNRGTDRELIRSTDPMAEFVDVRVEWRGANQWRMRLPLATETVRAEVRGSGERRKRKQSGPGFMTVPFTGNSADHFTVFTYFGHHHQDASGTWRASGHGVFRDAFALRGASSVFGTFYQDGWQAKSALYRFRR